MVGLDTSEWRLGIANVFQRYDKLNKGDQAWSMCPNGFEYEGSGLANLSQTLNVLIKGDRA